MTNPHDPIDINIDDLDSIGFFEVFDAPIAEFFDDQKLLTLTTTPKEATMKARKALEVLADPAIAGSSANPALGPMSPRAPRKK